jgi:uncharacterized membrane protein
MIEFAASVIIHRPVDEVFGFVADLDNLPRWVSGARIVKLSGDSFADGTIFREGKVTVRVSHFEMNKRVETESVHVDFPVSLIMNQSNGVLAFDPVDQGTQFTLAHKFRLKGLLRPLERIFEKKAQSETEAYLENLRALLAGS